MNMTPNLVNEIALDGNFFGQTSDPEQTYSFTQTHARDFPYWSCARSLRLKREIHEALMQLL
jgi:hypothetical protein